MKKKLVLGLVLAMSVSMLAGCGSNEDTADIQVEEAADTQTEETTEAETNDDTAEESTDTTATTSEAYEGDGWSLSYDPSIITATASDDGSVVFSYYTEAFTQAGTDYIMISKLTDTDYETVLADKQTEADAADAEINMSYYGAEGMTSYGFTKTSEPSEDSGLQIYQAYTAVPTGSDVVLVEYYITLESDEGNQMTIDAAFESLLQSFVVDGAEIESAN